MASQFSTGKRGATCGWTTGIRNLSFNGMISAIMLDKLNGPHDPSASAETLTALRWKLHTWTQDDRFRFDFVTSHAYTLYRIAHPSRAAH